MRIYLRTRQLSQTAEFDNTFANHWLETGCEIG